MFIKNFKNKKSLMNSTVLMSRKFDPLRNQGIINNLDNYLFKIKGKLL